MSERPKLDIGLNGETFRNYYYLKKELIDFCRKNNLPVSGSKVELADRIEYFLNTGKILQGSVKRKSAINMEVIAENTVIDKQFEYNTYIREFFAANQGRSLEEAIAYWKYKKSLPGHNHYEKSDLMILLNT